MKRLLSMTVIAVLCASVVSLAGCGPTATTNNNPSGTPTATAPAFAGAGLVGAGATFPGPVYAKWAQDFLKVETDAKVNYQAIGSGGGVQQFTAKTVDFGATDVPLKASEAAKIKGAYIEFPTCLGAVVVAYNLPAVKTPLKLDGAVTSAIFLGTIKKWNDPKIVALNPGVTLPNQPIQVVHRSDGSGTTKIFTGWLKNQSPDWAKKVGSDKSVQWPTGQGGNGNAGVAAAMKQTAGSIGYLELQYALTTGLGMASVKAPDGSYVVPSADTVASAASGLAFPITETTSITDSKTPGAYPISSTTYILIYKDQTDKAKAQTLVDFWTWALTKGQAGLADLHYAALPAKVQTDSLAQLGSITVGGSPVAPSAGVK